MVECDGCGKLRRDVRACGVDANGVADAPCLCFLCRREGEKGRMYYRTEGRYLAVWASERVHDQAWDDAQMEPA